MAHLLKEESKEFGSGVGFCFVIYGTKVTERGLGETLHVQRRLKWNVFCSSLSIQEKGAFCMCVLGAGVEYSSVTLGRVQVVSFEASGSGCWYLRHATGLDGK